MGPLLHDEAFNHRLNRATTVAHFGPHTRMRPLAWPSSHPTQASFDTLPCPITWPLRTAKAIQDWGCDTSGASSSPYSGSATDILTDLDALTLSLVDEIDPDELNGDGG